MKIVEEQHWQETFDMLWEHRAHEDYNGSSTKQRDFERSWYHSRSLEKELSLEQIRGNDAELPVNTMCHAAVQSFEEQLLDEEQIKQFVQTLPDTDRKSFCFVCRTIPLRKLHRSSTLLMPVRSASTLQNQKAAGDLQKK